MFGKMTTIDWGQVGIAAAVGLTAFFQKWDAIKVKRALEAEAKKRAAATEVRDCKLDAIHGLVNGTMIDQKRLTMLLAKRIAELTQNAGDIAIADEAEKDFTQHQQRISRST